MAISHKEYHFWWLLLHLMTFSQLVILFFMVVAQVPQSRRSSIKSHTKFLFDNRWCSVVDRKSSEIATVQTIDQVGVRACTVKACFKEQRIKKDSSSEDCQGNYAKPTIVLTKVWILSLCLGAFSIHGNGSIHWCQISTKPSWNSVWKEHSTKECKAQNS